MGKINIRFFFLMLVLFIIDRLAKYLAILKLPEAGVFVLKNFNFKLFYNPNLAFSLPLSNLLAIILTIIIVILLIYHLIRTAKTSTLGFFALSLILIGAVSNLIDRLRFGAVVDFLNFSFWPAFNLADVYIIAGALILILSLRKVNIRQNNQ